MSSEASKRLIDAAKELRVRLVEHGLRYGEQCQISHSELLAAIRDAERQAADDALPVNEKFLREMFPIPKSWYDDTILVGRDMVLVESAAGTWSLWHEGEEIVDFMTRKKVRNLIELMKGGDA